MAGDLKNDAPEKMREAKDRGEALLIVRLPLGKEYEIGIPKEGGRTDRVRPSQGGTLIEGAFETHELSRMKLADRFGEGLTGELPRIRIPRNKVARKTLNRAGGEVGKGAGAHLPGGFRLNAVHDCATAPSLCMLAKGPGLEVGTRRDPAPRGDVDSK